MIIPLHRLPDEGLAFEKDYAKGDLDLREHDLELTEPLNVNGVISQIREIIRVQGKLRARALRPCDRCLTEVDIAVDDDFELFYEPNETEVGSTSETEIKGRDLQVSVYEGDALDLDQLVIEQLALNVPTRVLCKDDCRGLCDQCGTDLNQSTCSCEQPVDPRWQILVDLKNTESGTE